MFSAMSGGQLVFSQVQAAALKDSLTGHEAVSRIELGGTGTARGSNQELPVDTLVYPNGQILYQIEAGFLHLQVGGRRKVFHMGTRFSVDGIDLKNDRLELKVANGNDRTKLKFLFGPNWQVRMSNRTVIENITEYLIIADVRLTKATGATPTLVTDTSLSLPKYSQAANSPAVPGRISNIELQSVFSEFDEEKRQILAGLNQDVRVLTRGLAAFQSAYCKWNDSLTRSALGEIVRLQSRLGADLHPHSIDDLVEMNALFERVAKLAQFREAVGAPRDKNTVYFQQLLVRSTSSDVAHRLTMAKMRIREVESAEASIVDLEGLLDAGDFKSASQKYQTISANSTIDEVPPAQHYLRTIQNLRADLALYVRASQLNHSRSVPIVEQVENLRKEIELHDQALDKSLALALLNNNIATDKQSLKEQVDSLLPFEFSSKPYSSRSVIGNSSSEANVIELNQQLTKLQAKLGACKDLDALLTNDSAMENLTSWFGADEVASLRAKGKDLSKAHLHETQLSTQVQQIHNQLAQENAQRIALLKAQNSLASKIVDDAITISMLNDQFRVTGIMGYLMEAKKRKEELANLVRSERKLLTERVRREINDRFQQVLPGLTINQASDAERIMAGLL
jgi:uncharacterized coiled-coil DUF342 family protein